MVEQKFSLELTKNGIQQTVYAKEGEALARKLRITLTCKGEVVSLTGYSLKVFFDDETYADEDFEEFGTVLLTNDGVSASFILPETLCASPGERFCELQLVKGAEKVYSAQFRVIVEDTFGAAASAGAIAEGFQYEPLFASAGGYSGTYDGSGVIPYYDETVGATKQLSPSAITAEIEGDIDDIETALDSKANSSDVTAALALKANASDVTSALALKADTSTVNTALSGKVDKVSGKGLSTNDYDATEKANVASNTLARHTHSNKTVLDKFGESSGTPTYDGNPIGGGGTITDVQDTDGNSLVDGGIATIPTGEMLEIVESAEQGVVISKYSRSEIYDLYAEGKALCCQGIPISTVVRGDNYYLYFISGGYNDTPYLSRREVKSDKTITTAQLVGYFTEREYTAAKDTKLSGIATGAEVNVIDTIKDSNGNPLTVTSKAVTLPAIPAAQIQSDWEQSDNTAKDYIKNKPSIPAAQVQADWNESDNTKADYIKNKPTIPSVAGKEDTANKVTSLSSSSTDTEYPSAKCVYDYVDTLVGNADTLLGSGVIS